LSEVLDYRQVRVRYPFVGPISRVVMPGDPSFVGVAAADVQLAVPLFAGRQLQEPAPRIVQVAAGASLVAIMSGLPRLFRLCGTSPQSHDLSLGRPFPEGGNVDHAKATQPAAAEGEFEGAPQSDGERHVVGQRPEYDFYLFATAVLHGAAPG
jgi:hypothetical protein